VQEDAATAAEQKKPANDERLYRVKVTHSSETGLYRFSGTDDLSEKQVVIIPTKYGVDSGSVLGSVSKKSEKEREEIQNIVRIATENDIKRISENCFREKQAFIKCREKIEARGLDMILVSAHYVLEEQKVLFFFTAEQRVDFRALVKDLVAEFKMRIELRQIGVRDEARVLGGLGVCGRYLCCHKVTDKLKPVSIKMAKEQNLSLNSMKISGPCGRLLCCLSYEYDFYCEEKKHLPAEGLRIPFKKDTYRVMEVNILTNTIKLSGQDGRLMDIPAANFSYSKDRKEWAVDLKEFL